MSRASSLRPREDQSSSAWPALLLALGSFAVYAALCTPVSGMGDGSEFTLVLATNGVAHPTGYPLYTLFGHLFAAALHALGAPWPLAGNLWSAVGAAVAVGFLFALAHRLTRGITGAGGPARLLAALVPTVLFATQPIFLFDAVAGEVNSWSAAWVSVASCAFVWILDGVATGPSRGRTRDWRGALAWGLVCGAGLAHHVTSVIVSAPLTLALLVVLARRGAPIVPWLVAAALGAALPIASYAFIAWRAWHPALVQWPALGPGAASVWAHVTGEVYRHFLGYFAPAEDQWLLIRDIALPFLGAGLVALAVGLVRARELVARATWAGLAGATALVTIFAFRYGVPDPAPYFLPAMALAAAATAPLLAALARPRIRGAALRLAIVALASLGLIVPWVRTGAEKKEAIESYDRLVRSMWSAVPPDTAIVFWPDDRYLRLREYQVLRGEKPNLLILNPELLLEDRTREQLRLRFGVDPVAGHPVPYIAPGSPDEAARIERYFTGVLRSFNDQVRAPVIVFDPSVPSVTAMRKPWESARIGGAASTRGVGVPSH